MAAHPGRHCPGRGLLRLPRLHGAARRWAPFTVEGQFWGSSQDTRHNLAVSWVCGVSLSFNLLVCVFLRELIYGCCARAGLRWGWAAALSSRSECIIAAGHLSGNSQDTRHKLALSSVFLAFSSSADLLWSTLRLSQLVSEVVGGCC